MSYESPLHDQTLAATSWLQLRYLPSELRISSARPNTCRDLLVTTLASTNWATMLTCTTKHLPRPLGYNSGINLVSYESPLHDQTLAATSWLQLRYLPSELRFSSARPNTCRDLLVTTPVSIKWATNLLCTTKHLPRPLGNNPGIYLVSYESPLHDQTLAATSWSQLRHLPTELRCSPAPPNTWRDLLVTTLVYT